MKDGGRPGRPKIWLMKTSSGRLAFHLTFRHIWIFLTERLVEMKFGVCSKTEKRTIRACNGKRKIHQDQKHRM